MINNLLTSIIRVSVFITLSIATVVLLMIIQLQTIKFAGTHLWLPYFMLVIMFIVALGSVAGIVMIMKRVKWNKN